MRDWLEKVFVHQFARGQHRWMGWTPATCSEVLCNSVEHTLAGCAYMSLYRQGEETKKAMFVRPFSPVVVPE